MKVLYIALTLTLLTSWTPLFSQGTRTVSTERLRSALKDLAELDRRRKDAISDSLTIVALKAAYSELQTALAECQIAVREGALISADDNGLLDLAAKKVKALQKALRGQKLLKWLGWVAVFFAYLAATR